MHYWHQMNNCVLYILFPCCYFHALITKLRTDISNESNALVQDISHLDLYEREGAELVRVLKCQNSFFVSISSHHILPFLYCFCFWQVEAVWHFPVFNKLFLTSSDFGKFKLWHFPDFNKLFLTSSDFDKFKFWYLPDFHIFLTFSISDKYTFWHFQIFIYFWHFQIFLYFWHFQTFIYFWHFQFLTSSDSDKFNCWHFSRSS